MKTPIANRLSSPADISSTVALPAEHVSTFAVADFYELTKPRLNFLVVLTTMAGFCIATSGKIDWILLLHTIMGTALTAAGASVLNQYMERGYDALMPRTANRPLPAGRIAPLDALLYGVILASAGVMYLGSAVNFLTALLAAVALVIYVFLYTPLKRWTSLCTLIGAIPGAIPPVMGFTAARAHISIEAMSLFAILFLWQMPHFLAIGILYRTDYARAGFKMLPVVDPGLKDTGCQIVMYAMGVIPASLAPVGLGMAGWIYGLGAMVMGLTYLGYGVNCAHESRRQSARWLFLVSILYLPLLLAFMMLDRTLP